MDNIKLLNIYRAMYRSRLFEEHVVRKWNEGFITGEMHTSIGEEAINAGIITQLVEDDALALDHRGTSPALMRGIDPKELLLEFMGHQQGLCLGMGGHMHIFSKSHLLASSGIVGSSGPAAAGFALAAQHLRPGAIAVAFFGEGAINQGMLMESMNLASVLKLPVLFVCKDSGMAITTVSKEVTAGSLINRAEGFDIPSIELNGTDVEVVWNATNEAIARARSGDGPTFIQAHCRRPHGHFLGDPLLRIVNKPIKELKKISSPLVKSSTRRGGASLKGRLGSIKEVSALLTKTAKGRFFHASDPLSLIREKLKVENKEIEIIEDEIIKEMERVIEEVLEIYKDIEQV